MLEYIVFDVLHVVSTAKSADNLAFSALIEIQVMREFCGDYGRVRCQLIVVITGLAQKWGIAVWLGRYVLEEVIVSIGGKVQYLLYCCLYLHRLSQR